MQSSCADCGTQGGKRKPRGGRRQADAAQQDVNKNHRLGWRGNEAGNKHQQLQQHWQNEAMGNYQLTQEIAIKRQHSLCKNCVLPPR